MTAVETDTEAPLTPEEQQEADAAYAELDAIRVPLREHRAEADRLHERRVQLYVVLDRLRQPSSAIGKHIDEGAGSVRVALAKAKAKADRDAAAAAAPPPE